MSFSLFSFYSSKFQESLPDEFIIGEMESVRIVEQLRIKYNQIAQLPVGPWTLEDTLQQGPLELTGECTLMSQPPENHMPVTCQQIEGLARETPFNQMDIILQLQRSAHFPIFPVISEKSISNKKTLKRADISKCHTPPKLKTSSSSDDFSKEKDSYSCNKCTYASKYKSNIVRHVRSHTGEKPFQCSICTSKFVDSSNLKAHMQRHADTPFVCKTCGNVFSGQNNLQSHMKTHEKPTVKFSGVCLINECKDFMKKFTNLGQHCKMVHRITSLDDYRSVLSRQYSPSSIKSRCSCAEHYSWIYLYTGANHNCYLCECKYKFAKEDGEWTRKCSYRY